jgi:glyoxylase-like metal-dependent hydrolase (beta-lactamase superfamily II)
LTLGRGGFRVNCYLISADRGFVLVDTGTRRQRAKLMEWLGELDCMPGLLRLVLITHGDYDHIGSAAYLRQTYGAPIAMHENDVPMSSTGDMFAGRRQPTWLVRAIAALVLRLPESDRFEPDTLIDESSDLAEYGLPGARVLLLRGHSDGSIGLLLSDGTLVCGDVLENVKGPRLGSIMDDLAAARTSLDRLGQMEIGTVYPGHGMPFEFGEIAVSRGLPPVDVERKG